MLPHIGDVNRPYRRSKKGNKVTSVCEKVKRTSFVINTKVAFRISVITSHYHTWIDKKQKFLAERDISTKYHRIVLIVMCIV